MSEIIVTVADISAAKICLQGARQKAAKFGIDWNEFRRHGLPVEVFESWNHAMADRCARIARQRAAREND